MASTREEEGEQCVHRGPGLPMLRLSSLLHFTDCQETLSSSIDSLLLPEKTRLCLLSLSTCSSRRGCCSPPPSPSLFSGLGSSGSDLDNSRNASDDCGGHSPRL